jgi:hypothetical protein
MARTGEAGVPVTEKEQDKRLLIVLAGQEHVCQLDSAFAEFGRMRRAALISFSASLLLPCWALTIPR